jgi:hypothetical protein
MLEPFKIIFIHFYYLSSTYIFDILTKLIDDLCFQWLSYFRSLEEWLKFRLQFFEDFIHLEVINLLRTHFFRNPLEYTMYNLLYTLFSYLFMVLISKNGFGLDKKETYLYSQLSKYNLAELIYQPEQGSLYTRIVIYILFLLLMLVVLQFINMTFVMLILQEL